MKANNYSIHPSVYFIVAALLIAYFFPREGKFRYQFYEGKPWRYGLLTAPSDFPIYKTDAEVQAERDSALKKFEPYYRLDTTIESEEIDKLRADYQGTLRNRATPAYMQYIENSLQKLYRDGIISTQDMDELKKEEYPRINLLASSVAHPHYSSNFFTVKTAYEFIINNCPSYLDKSVLQSCDINNYLVENITYEEFMKQVHGTYTKLDNISLGLASLGCAWEKIDIDVDALVLSAENMMREEKKKYYKNLRKGHHEPIIKQDLLEDIEEGRFIVCLVPKIDVATGNVAGAEAVVRYHHKDLGIMEPGRYINLLEETRLSHYLDLYVFEEVCKTLHRWELDNLPMIPVSVNFAGTTLRQDNLIEEMEKLIDRYRVRCEYLEVEVSESYADMNQEMLAETSSKIRKANVRVILDHFGSKNSSFSILSLMEFDGLKLDKSVISNLVGNRRSRLVAKAVIDICRQLGAVVMASGVETQDQVNVLEELGCDYAQGSFFNKAITIETFEVRYLKE